MGKKYEEPKSGGVANERFAHRGDKGWEQPRDADRDPEAFDPAQAAADAARHAGK